MKLSISALLIVCVLVAREVPAQGETPAATSVPSAADQPVAEQQDRGGERPTTRDRRGRGRFGGPIVLGPDDKPVFDDPPAGFNVVREDIPHGKVEMIQYDSKTVGTRRNMLVYTPPGYASGD